MNLRTEHLTDEEFSDYLIDGVLPVTLEAHVSECARCQKELAVFGESMADYAEASLAFVNSRPVPVIAFPAKASWWRLTVAPAAWAVAAALLIAAALPVWHADQRSAKTSVAQTAAVPDSASEIAQDNALMKSVDVALAANDASPLDEFHIADPLDGHSRPATRHRP